MDVVDAIPKTDVPAALTAALFPGVTAPAGEGVAPAIDPGRFSRELASFVELISPEVVVASDVAATSGNLPAPPVAVTSVPQIPDLQLRIDIPQSADSTTPALLTEAPPADSLPAELTFFLDGFLAAAATSEPTPGSIGTGETATADVATDDSADAPEPDKSIPSLIAALSTSLLASSSPATPLRDTGAPTNDDALQPPPEVAAPPVELTRFLSRPAFNAPAPAPVAVERNSTDSDHTPEPAKSDSISELPTQVQVSLLPSVAVPVA
ncbi:MAG: hypothetical protein B7Z55_17685, partial [Planctomycetales bacterium 12-60-4]